MRRQRLQTKNNMKQSAETSPIVASTGMTSSVMGIDPKHAARITKYLRDSIYSDKVRAVVHELIANALDEHRKYDVAKPVQTGIRNSDSGYIFYVRDFAKGLSEKDVREVFGMYANSTKLDNNNQQGCFGIGSKSFHSYTDTFFVDSHFEGVKKTYACALGGDEMNVSVGHIYQVNEEPTNETGLEVYGEVKSVDISDFSNKIRGFVSVSPDNISADILGQEILPIKPSFQTKLGNYNMRVLEYFSNEKLYLQMGGNTYQKLHFSGDVGGTIKDGHVVVIDIPIGDCSVTLSRESFEETRKNKEILSEIETLLQNYVTKDMSQFKDKKILDLVGDALSGLRKYESEAFAYFAQDIYSDCWDFVKSINIQGFGAKMIQNDKPVCVVMPTNGILAHWKEKVVNHFKSENLSCYVAQRDKFTSPEIHQTFHIVCARKLKYAKAARDSKRYTVKTGKRNFGIFNSLEFFNAVAAQLTWNIVANNEKEATDFMTTKKTSVTSKHHVDYLRICQSAGNYKQWSTQSNKLFAAIIALGFIGEGSAEDRAICDRLDKIVHEAHRKESLVRNAKKKWFTIHPRIQAAYQKEKNASRVSKFWCAVMSEDSLRSKILCAYENSYGNLKLERKDLRRILKLV